MSDHPSVLMREEMEARGWDLDRLATAMLAAEDGHWQAHRLALDLYFELGPTDRAILMGQESAEAFARAFGTSPELWLSLHADWCRSGEVEP